MLRNHSIIKYLFNRELSEMYVSIALKDLSLSMIGIFVPIYLLVDLKYSFSSVMLFFLFYSISMLFSSLLAAKFTSKYGIKHGILLSMFGFIIYITLLSTLHYHNLYIISAVIGGISNTFYWVNFHADFIKFSDHKNRGREVSMWFIVAYIGLLLGPIMGSIIITYLGFTTLFIIVNLLLLLSSLPLFFSSEVYEPMKFSMKYLFEKSYLKDTFVYLIYGVRMMVGGVALPIFLFFLLNKYLSLGVIASFASLGAIIVGYLVGRLSRDENRERTMFRFGSLFHSLGWFILLFVKSFIQLAVVNIYLAISFIFVDISHHSIFYSKAKRHKSVMGYIVYREIAADIGRIFIVLIMLLTGKLIYSFIINGIGMFFWFFL